MPFFIRGRNKRSAKAPSSKVKSKRNRVEIPSKKPQRDSEESEELTSDEDEIVSEERDFARQEEVSEEEETPQDKKVRLATQYLEELKKQKEREGNDDIEIDEAINKKLREDNLEAAGKLQRQVADTLNQINAEDFLILRCKQHKLPLTCIVVSNDERFIYSSSKDCSIVQWSLAGEKIGVINSRFSHKCNDKCIHHQSHIISLTLSTDGKFLASGDVDGIIHLWNGDSLEHIKTFKKHKGSISGLSFRKGTHTLFSASHDRLVMVWDLDSLAFVDNLGGHQDSITGIDALSRESCITSGGRDETIIVYAIAEEKQLRFTGRQGSIDGVKLINEKTFLSYGQNGSLDLWTTMKKRPHNVVSCAHGRDEVNGEPYWITAAAAFVNTDLIATGSMDGFIRFWKVNFGQRIIHKLFAVPVTGVVNCLEFSSSGSYLVAAVGREHKLGRWYNLKSAKNSIIIIPLEINL